MSGWSQMSLGRKAAYLFAAMSLVLVFIAFTTPYWLASDPRVYSAQLLRLGLWETCFRSFADPRDLNKEKYYVGCRWIFAYEYNTLRDFIEIPFFVAVQVFFTIGFTLLLLACVLLLAMHICLPSARTHQLLKVVIALLVASAVCNTIAVIVFGARGDGRDWMPDPDHNFLSWSFALGVIGAFCTYVAAVLFAVDSRRMARKLDEQEHQQQAYSMNPTHTMGVPPPQTRA
uniref:Putative conserved plasma membrane protein n=1 Tax=Amblyomma triste TaxID=251400 RepID=A0A023G4G7_AMBTT